MKSAAAFDCFIFARDDRFRWHEFAGIVADDTIRRNGLAGGAWIIKGNQGRRIGSSSRRRAPRHHNDEAAQ